MRIPYQADTTYVILGLGGVINIPGVIALSASDDALKRVMSNSEVLLPEIMAHKELYLEVVYEGRTKMEN